MLYEENTIEFFYKIQSICNIIPIEERSVRLTHINRVDMYYATLEYNQID